MSHFAWRAAFLIQTGIMLAATQFEGPLFALAFAGWLALAVANTGETP